MKNVLRAIVLVMTLPFASAAHAEIRCGMLAGKTVRVDSSYLFFPLVYEGVDYWGPEASKQHATKGCSDKLRSFTVAVDWPSLKPSGRLNHFTAPNARRIGITYDANYSDNPIAAMRWTLSRQLSKSLDEVTTELSVESMRKMSTYDSDLGMWVFKPRPPSEHVDSYIFWTLDDAGRAVSSKTECSRSTVKSWCEARYYEPITNVWTSIDFTGQWVQVLPEMRQAAQLLFSELTRSHGE